ncbi:MAG: uridine phosphorylase, partial [Clostridia bacterium]|nr:uridine phosphorylase [Clostridia bacterium]
DGTSKEYMPLEFPAVADLEITNALVKAGGKLGFPYHTGIVQAKDSFYGQHSPDTMGCADELKSKWSAWIKGGCLASEMESATMFVLASLRRVRAGAIFHCVWNQEIAECGMPEKRNTDTDCAVKTAVEAVRLLIKADKEK